MASRLAAWGTRSWSVWIFGGVHQLRQLEERRVRQIVPGNDALEGALSLMMVQLHLASVLGRVVHQSS